MANADERRYSISVCLSVSEESKISNQMSHPNLWQLAQRGNVSAIAALLNRSFHNSITVKAGLKDGCLRVMLESAQVLEQDTSVTIIRQGMMRLQPASIHSVKVYGRQIGKNIPVWSEEFSLQLPNLKQLAKQGDLEAIALTKALTC